MRRSKPLVFILLCASVAGIAVAQEEPVTPEPPPPSHPRYLLPDLAPRALIYDGTRLWFKPIFAIIGDGNWFDQDAASLAQVGEQEDQLDLRAGRVGFVLRGKGETKWELFTAADFQEAKNRRGPLFDTIDLRISVPLGPVKLSVGKQKEPFVYEMVGLASNLPQQERILSPFFVSRSDGVQLAGRLAGDRMTWAVGWFNDWFETDTARSDSGNDYVGRLTGLASISPDARDYLHLGLGMRHVEADKGDLRFSGRPESNVADRYVDSGKLPSDDARELSLEALWNHGPVSLLLEHVEAQLDAPAVGDPHFSGSYVVFSWVVTGENRPYDRASGYARAIVPESRIGAWELVARYSTIDLTDRAVDGGELDKWYAGVNWWISQQWKVGLGWGDAELDKNGLEGTTRSLQLRLQWTY